MPRIGEDVVVIVVVVATASRGVNGDKPTRKTFGKKGRRRRKNEEEEYRRRTTLGIWRQSTIREVY